MNEQDKRKSLVQGRKEREVVKHLILELEKKNISTAKLCQYCQMSPARWSMIKNGKALLRLKDTFKLFDLLGYECNMKLKIKHRE